MRYEKVKGFFNEYLEVRGKTLETITAIYAAHCEVMGEDRNLSDKEVGLAIRNATKAYKEICNEILKEGK